MTTNRNSFNGSSIGGDVVVGDKYQYDAPQSPLEVAIRTIQKSICDDAELKGVIEQLAEYVTDHPNRPIIGVEGKLKQGKRSDLVPEAIRLKNRFARKLAKRQMSLVEQKVYAHVLAEIMTAFKHNVHPLIVEKKGNSVVDKAIYDFVIAPVYKAVVSFDTDVTSDLVAGMLYFLTGKCHIVWAAEC